MNPTVLSDLPEVSDVEWAGCLGVVRSMRVAVFVVAYNAEAHIRETLRRIPANLVPHLAAIYVIDDKSVDRTTEVAGRLKAEVPGLEVFTTPFNQGYGGNQKLGFSYAIRRQFDIVVLLHGDGQYAPEVLPRILNPFSEPDIDEIAFVTEENLLVEHRVETVTGLPSTASPWPAIALIGLLLLGAGAALRRIRRA